MRTACLEEMVRWRAHGHGLVTSVDRSAIRVEGLNAVR